MNVSLPLMQALLFHEFQAWLTIQFQKTQGFCVADFATLPDKRRSRSKLFLLFMYKRTLRSKI